MPRRVLIACLTLASLMSGKAIAQQIVSEWNVQDTDKWFYNDFLNQIHITDSDADVFSFEIYNASTGDPMDIDLIVCDTNDPVRVRVAAEPNSPRTYGARHIHEIDLSASSDGEITDLYISGNLGLFGPTMAKRVQGPITIEGSTFFPIVSDEIIATVSVGSFASIHTGTLGHVFISGAGPHGIDIHVAQNYSSGIIVNGSVSSGFISVGGNFSGMITALGSGGGSRGDFKAKVSIGGDFVAPGRIVVRDLGGTSAGNGLFIGGSITGTPDDYPPLIDLTGDLLNTLLVCGSLKNVCTDTVEIPEIRIEGELTRLCLADRVSAGIAG